MYQIQKQIEIEIASDVWVFDKYQKVGPEFKTPSGLYNYIRAVIHPNDFSVLYAFENWSDDESTIDFNCEYLALDEWCAEFERCTTNDGISITM